MKKAECKTGSTSMCLAAFALWRGADTLPVEVSAGIFSRFPRKGRDI